MVDSRDGLGRKPPERLAKLFKEANSIQKWANKLSGWGGGAGTLMVGEAGELIDWVEVVEVTTSVSEHIRSRIPYSPCPVCHFTGKTSYQCACHGRGWVTRGEYERAIEALDSTAGGGGVRNAIGGDGDSGNDSDDDRDEDDDSGS